MQAEEEKLRGRCKRRDDRCVTLGMWQTVGELLEAKPAEHSGAQTLSTADRLSEVEMLRIVRDLNEGSTKS